MARLNFDPRQVEPNQVFEPIPTSWYTGQVVESEMKPTSSSNGHYLELKVQILGGDYNNRTVFDRLNLDNPNQQTVDIAYRTLSAICHAVGLGNQEVEDSAWLHGKPFLVKVNERPARTDPTTGTRYEAGNEIKGYKAIDPTAQPVLGPRKAEQRPFQGAPNGPAGVGAGFPGAGVQGQAAPPTGWGNQHANQPTSMPQAGGVPNGGWGNNPPARPQEPVQAPVQPPAQLQPQAQGVPPQRTQQPPVYQQENNPPQSNVGNPALAQGTPPPWAQAQPNGNGATTIPPWQKQ
jgi:hypothetical protein